MARENSGFTLHTTEFGRYALNSKGVPEKFEEWATAMYGVAPKTKKKKRK